jgi:hypothetical protein
MGTQAVQVASSTSTNDAAASPQFARGGKRPITLLISPKPARLGPIRAAVHEALPGGDTVVCLDARQALIKADTARHFGWIPSIFVLDYRGGRPKDLAEQLRRVRHS